MNTKVKNISLIVAIAASVCSFNASATDAKYYSGSTCQPFSGKDAQHFQTTAQGGIKNQTYGINSTKVARRVTCPIVRDKLGNTNGTSNVLVSVYRVNPANNPLPTNTPINCTIFSTSKTGINTVDSHSASHTGTGQKWLKLDLHQSESYGGYAFVCNIPEGSAVLSYYVKEF